MEQFYNVQATYQIKEKKDGGTYDYVQLGGYDKDGEYVEIQKIFLGSEDSQLRYIFRKLNIIPKKEA